MPSRNKKYKTTDLALHSIVKNKQSFALFLDLSESGWHLSCLGNNRSLKKKMSCPIKVKSVPKEKHSLNLCQTKLKKKSPRLIERYEQRGKENFKAHVVSYIIAQCRPVGPQACECQCYYQTVQYSRLFTMSSFEASHMTCHLFVFWCDFCDLCQMLSVFILLIHVHVVLRVLCVYVCVCVCVFCVSSNWQMRPISISHWIAVVEYRFFAVVLTWPQKKKKKKAAN